MMNDQTENKRKNIRLGRLAFYRLAQWIEENQGVVRSKTVDDLATQAASELGFQITPSIMKNACSELDILPFKQKPRNSGDRTRIVAAELVGLMQALGHKPSEALLKVWRGESLEK